MCETERATHATSQRPTCAAASSMDKMHTLEWGGGRGRERHETRSSDERLSSTLWTLVPERDFESQHISRRSAVRTSDRGQRPPLARAPLLSGPSACGGGGPALRSARTAPPRAAAPRAARRARSPPGPAPGGPARRGRRPPACRGRSPGARRRAGGGTSSPRAASPPRRRPCPRTGCRTRRPSPRRTPGTPRPPSGSRSPGR
mmetsp:Transcript_13052/g.38621  ORF Transcript_13052/g.38621 Transcript_13052/m.38621 type:complete len:203 (-) Transcript_13052:10-618(-)